MRTAAPAVSDVTVASQRLLALRGVLLLIFGLAEGGLVVFAYQLPRYSSWQLVFVLAAFLLADGLAMLVDSITALHRRGRWMWQAAGALAGIAAAVIVLFATPSSLTAFAWWAIVTGLLEACAPLSRHGRTPWRIAVAALSVALGLFILAGPFQDAVRLLLSIAAYGVIAGGLRVQAARRGIRWTDTS
jgi:uncharacterized membrane protein HdeD (DUF308 family)